MRVMPKEARSSGSPGATAKDGCESHRLTAGTGNGGIPDTSEDGPCHLLAQYQVS